MCQVGDLSKVRKRSVTPIQVAVLLKRTMDVSGKIAIVTGANSGIGLAFTRLFLSVGGSVVAADVTSPPNPNPLQEQFKGKYEFAHCDVSDFKSVQNLFQTALDRFGAIHVVLNNAGIGGSTKYPFISDKPITERDVKEWDRVVRIDLDGVMYGTALAIRHISPPGVILNVASMAGLIPMPFGPEYSAAKHGVVGLTRSVADVLRKKKKIRAYAICPSFVLTGLTSSGMNESKEFEKQVKAVSKGKLMDASMVAQAMLDLVQNDPGAGANKVVLRLTFEKGVDFQSYSKM
jgi:NAD(P)-dependent dehydrogenase (short-subunit alcohol dehydrogenase family)